MLLMEYRSTNAATLDSEALEDQLSSVYKNVLDQTRIYSSNDNLLLSVQTINLTKSRRCYHLHDQVKGRDEYQIVVKLDLEGRDLHPRSPSAKAHDVGATCDFPIVTPSLVIVAI